MRDRLEPVLEVAERHAAQVDTEGRFPAEALEALVASGLMGLTLPRADGGLGAGPPEFVEVTSALAAACGSTSLIYLMHVSAAMVVAAAPPPRTPEALRRLAAGDLLGTLAFSERGSRSHFWAPVSRAVAENGGMRLRAEKSFVTSAGHAGLYVVSTGASTGNGAVDLYALPGDVAGLEVAGPWRGLGMRGNASSPMAVDSVIDGDLRLGSEGQGFQLMMDVVLPWFNLGNAAVSVGLASAAVEGATRHVIGSRLEHLGQSLAEIPAVRARLARMRIALDAQRAYLRHAAASMAAPSDETLLHVLGVKASANDAAVTITDEAMRVCGGAAFASHVGVERPFRDARAGHVMAPTADVLYDFYGKAITGQELF
ncbi:MAG: acyl-CoA dehydrogenase family protein [Actinomycetota bacterium]|jgi:alkylation response protein AidB-like acyl-CoA dehydrogenase